MSYRVTCGCGKGVPVRAGDAGSTVRCECGRAVEVPSLHELRAAAGEEALAPLVRVRTKLAAGQLPGGRGCVVCGREPAANASVYIECERVQVKGGLTKGNVLAGCAVGLLFGWVAGGLALLRFRDDARQYGTDEFVHVPLPACDSCRPTLSDPTALRDALRAVPDYADLLDRYPGARVLLRGA